MDITGLYAIATIAGVVVFALILIRLVKRSAIRRALQAKQNWSKRLSSLERSGKESVEANRQGNFTNLQRFFLMERLNSINWKQPGRLFLVIVLSSLASICVTMVPLSQLSPEIGVLSPIIFIVVAVIGIIWLIIRTKNKFGQIIRQGIDNSTGRYYFDINRKRYIAQLQDYELQPITATNLVPGPYRFYFVPKLKLWLSAEPCDLEFVPSFNTKTDSLNAILARVIGFDTEDLNTNKNGRLTKQQAAKLMRQALVSYFIVIVCCFLLALLIIMFFSLGIGHQSFWLPFIIPLTGAIASAPKYYRTTSDTRNGIVMSVNGYGWPKKYGEESTTEKALGLVLDLSPDQLSQLLSLIYSFATLIRLGEKYRYHIEEKTFDVPKIIWTILGEGRYYQAYYVPRTNKLLSIEYTKV